MGTLGQVDPAKAARSHPTPKDIAWAAGIFEGEGCAAANGHSQFAGVTQKDPWLVNKLRDLFGGSVRETYRKESWRGFGEAGAKYYHWSVSGTRCRGFLMTIYSFMSPRRKEQIKWTLKLQSKEEYLSKIKA